MTSFALKIIALAAMVIDHAGDVFALSIPNSFLLRLVGRTAFPIYAFLIAEGCRRTKDIKKYMLRLGAFALISEIPFDLCFENEKIFSARDVTFLSFSYQNIFFTLFLSVLAVYAWEYLKETKYKIAGALAVLAAAGAAELINADYGAKAIIFIFALYLAGENKKARVLVMIAGAAAIYLPSLGYIGILFGHSYSVGLAAFLSASLSALPVFFYNGRRGPKLKYFFYAMYPLHLLALAAAHLLPALIT